MNWLNKINVLIITSIIGLNFYIFQFKSLYLIFVLSVIITLIFTLKSIQKKVILINILEIKIFILLILIYLFIFIKLDVGIKLLEIVILCTLFFGIISIEKIEKKYVDKLIYLIIAIKFVWVFYIMTTNINFSEIANIRSIYIEHQKKLEFYFSINKLFLFLFSNFLLFRVLKFKFTSIYVFFCLIFAIIFESRTYTIVFLLLCLFTEDKLKIKAFSFVLILTILNLVFFNFNFERFTNLIFDQRIILFKKLINCYFNYLYQPNIYQCFFTESQLDLEGFKNLITYDVDNTYLYITLFGPISILFFYLFLYFNYKILSNEKIIYLCFIIILFQNNFIYSWFLIAPILYSRLKNKVFLD